MTRLFLLLAAALLGTVTVSASPVSDSLAHYYAVRDTDAIERLYENAETLEDRLLCSYRLFPMTRDDAWLRDIPQPEQARTARELALIAAHWAYRAANAPAWRLPTYGRRSESILNRARALDPDEPYVLLVDGQSLYYKPGIFGGDVEQAQRRFEQLRGVLQRNAVPGIHPLEAEIWIWMSLRKRDEDSAATFRERLLARRPPPMFHQFLIDPP